MLSNTVLTIPAFMALDIEKAISRVTAGQILTEPEIVILCTMARQIFSAEANVVNFPAPCTIVGDIHGYFTDLLEMFRYCGRPPYTSYVFLGDYGDRGYYSIECTTLLLLYKIRYPRKISMIRGNHESRQVTQVYGFYDEVMRKYGNLNVWRHFTSLFDYLPLVTVVENYIYGVHGGLSPAIDTLDQVRKIERIQEVPHDGPMADQLWSDPEQRVGWGRSPRGAGFTFGQDVTEQFLRTNYLKMIARAHQLTMEGYQWHHNRQAVTIFSAPNYCYRSGNKGAVMEYFEDGSYDFIQYEYAPKKGEVFCGKRITDYFL